MKSMHPTGPGHFGVNERGIIALLNPERLRRILSKMLDENEFLGPYGLRALSKFHERNPYIFNVGGQEYRVDYLPAESDSGMFGGNSNWRGPVWFPVNYLIIEALQRYHHFWGDELKVECPTGSGKMLTLREVALELCRRLLKLFIPDATGTQSAAACHGNDPLYAADPNFRGLHLFHEYFHGDTGQGLGASHQTGWTALIIRCMEVLAAASHGK